MFNSIKIAALTATVNEIDEDVNDLCDRTEETEVNLEAYRLASLATAEGATILLNLVTHLNDRVTALEADKRERDARDINAACGPVNPRRPRDIY